MKKTITAKIVLTIFLCFATTSESIEIVPTYTGFNANQQSVIGDAINHWTTMVGGGPINLDFIADNTVGLASTSNWATNAAGTPISADIRVNTAAYNWTTGPPALGQIDAMRGMMHEVNHAIGWTVNLADFGTNVTTVGGNRFYDLNHNGTFQGGADFDLFDSPAAGTHATDGSGDLMERFAPTSVRRFPTYQHAGVLTDAFGYDVMINGLGGPAGYGDLAMGRNDDGSSDRLDLPFEINFYGNTYDQFWVNNNGNVSFSSSLSQYTPVPFPVANQPMIAPFWGDVDTRPAGGGEVYVASPSEDVAIVTWDNVGFYSNNTNPTNDFQMVLRNRDDIAPGDFDIEFRYDRLDWTTGQASGGNAAGLGGTPAQAGYDAGDLTNFLSLPGSGTAAVLNLEHTTNTPPNVDIEGLWVFAVRGGNPPGTTSDNPLMPVVVDDDWRFDFNIGNIDDPVFIDPLVAIGYDYIVDSGPYFASVLLPIMGDNSYDLWQWGGAAWFDPSIVITGGAWYDFVAPVDRFRILGIEESLGLDPLDPTAFVTGLKFASLGVVTMTMTPIVVPVPTSVLLCGIGLGFSSWRLKRKKNKQL